MSIMIVFFSLSFCVGYYTVFSSQNKSVFIYGTQMHNYN